VHFHGKALSSSLRERGGHPIAAGYQILIYSIFPLKALDRYVLAHEKVDQNLSGRRETFCERTKRLTAPRQQRKLPIGQVGAFESIQPEAVNGKF
jgi:hypothetical protein